MGEGFTVLVTTGDGSGIDGSALERALDGAALTVVRPDAAGERDGPSPAVAQEFDCVVAASAEAATAFTTAQDGATTPVIVVADEPAEAVADEWIRFHPASDLTTLESRVADAVHAERHRTREREQQADEEGALLGRAEAYRTLVENLPSSGVALFDRDLRYLWAGGGVFDLVNLNPDDVEGKSLDEVHSPQFVERHGDEYRAVFDGQRTSFSFSFDGREFVSQLIPITEADEVIMGMTMTRDVTDERGRHRELTVRTRAMDAASHGLCLTDPHEPDNPLVYVNEGYQQLTGYDEEEVLGRNPRHLQGPMTEPDLAREMGEAVENVESCTVEITNYRKDGTPFVNHVEISPVFDESGELVHFVGSQVDVTEQHERERALARQNERLQEFTSIVSHDLRSPLSVVSGRISLAQRTGDLSHLEHAEEAAERMDELINDLLTLAREGEFLDYERVDALSLEAVVREAWNTVDTGDARLVVTDDAELFADESRLRQLLENCVHNSIEHGVTSGGDGDGDPTLTVRVGPLADEAGFFVEDDGVGIADSVAERMFEAGVTTADDGTGFGLAIVRTVAEAHGWTVSTTTSAAGGARFEFRTGRQVADDS